MILALTAPTQGDGNEERFNTWYDETHIPELLSVDGITSARRFKVVHGNLPQSYAAAYEVETDDLDKVLGDMMSGMGEFPPEFDQENSANLIAIEITK